MQRGEDQMTGERSLNCDLGGLEIARFANHDPIRILPKKSAQYPRKSQPDGFVHRHLNDSLEIVFDRLFCSEKLGIDAVDIA